MRRRPLTWPCLLMVLIALAVVSWLLPAGKSAAEAPEAAGKKLALLVGVNKYDKRGFRDLEFAERDVEELAKMLEQAGYEVHLLTGSAPGDRRATLENTRQAVKAVLKGRTKRDLILVALAGHGMQIEVPGPDGKLQSDSFFCPCDAQKSDSTTMLSMGRLFADIEDHGGGTNLVLVDACREDPTRGRGMDGSTVKTLPEGLAVLFGCRAGQKTFEHKNAGGGHGVFFHYVLEGLRGSAKNQQGEVTWTQLVEFVSDRVKNETPRLLEDNGIRQQPVLIANLEAGKLVLLSPSTKNESSFAGTRAGQEWDGNGLKMKFCWCPAGKFMMGSPRGQNERDDFDEGQVSVTLSRGFWLGKYEVTQGEWKPLMGDQPWSGKENVKEGAAYPATYVNWDDAAKFCEELTRKERAAGRLPVDWEYTLPTEAQWEYACRAGKTTRFSFSDDEAGLSDYAWWDKNAHDAGEAYAHEVGTKRANPWGLHDMHGNVWEWCRDYYAKDRPGGTDPEVKERASDRVSRGGSWSETAGNCRSASRFGHAPVGNVVLGFRVALAQSSK